MLLKRFMCFAVLAVALAGVVWTPASAATDPYQWALVDLDYIRMEKAAQVERHFERLRGLADSAAHDDVMRSFFQINLAYERGMDEGGVPDEFQGQVMALRDNFNDWYIENYYAFYDILFIDDNGEVFYTIRKEDDLHVDLSRGQSAETPLGRAVAAGPGKPVFVDYHLYGPSNEPAAFFLMPVRVMEGGVAGWIALQCTINPLDSLFTSAGETGQTGETFLVNEDGFMLTESHFRGESTILATRLADRNISAKFQAGKGHLTVTDYRGQVALSSFAVVEFMDTRWLVVVKVDKAEVVTREYQSHRRFYDDGLLERIAGTPCPPADTKPLETGEMATRVDMDEFAKARCGERLETWGITTCTGLLVAYPGRFGYLAHISVKDDLLGGSETNLLGQIINNIERFDISQNEKRAIVFLVVAPHADGVARITDRLVAEGFLLSQIRVLSCSGAEEARMAYECGEDGVQVSWKGLGNEGGVHRMSDAIELGEVMEELIAENYGL